MSKRLVAGACAGMTATALTHPLDTVRLRLALPNHPYKGELLTCTGFGCDKARSTWRVLQPRRAPRTFCLVTRSLCAGLGNAMVTIATKEGPMALYKGLVPTLLGIAPYAALNFALYDLAKTHFYEGGRPQGVLSNLGLGAVTGTVAATVCYPLDTVRRRMQMQGTTYNSQLHAFQSIFAKVPSPSLPRLPSRCT